MPSCDPEMKMKSLFGCQSIEVSQFPDWLKRIFIIVSATQWPNHRKHTFIATIVQAENAIRMGGEDKLIQGVIGGFGHNLVGQLFRGREGEKEHTYVLMTPSVSKSHVLTVWSQEPVSRVLLLIHSMLETFSLWPVMVFRGTYENTKKIEKITFRSLSAIDSSINCGNFQTFKLPFQAPVANKLLSSLRATLDREELWPSMVLTNFILEPFSFTA